MKVKLTQNYNGNFRGETIEVDDLLGHSLIGVDMAEATAVLKESLSTEPIDENKAIVPKYKKKK